MTAQFVLIVLAVITAILLGLIIPLYLRLAKLEEQLGEVEGEAAPAPTLPSFSTPPMRQGPLVPLTPLPATPISAESPSSFARAPAELSASEQARLDLQRSVEQARLNKLEALTSPPMVSSPESTVERADATAQDGGHFEIPCPEGGFTIPISATDEGTRYVCPQCNQPIKFED